MIDEFEVISLTFLLVEVRKEWSTSPFQESLLMGLIFLGVLLGKHIFFWELLKILSSRQYCIWVGERPLRSTLRLPRHRYIGVGLRRGVLVFDRTLGATPDTISQWVWPSYGQTAAHLFFVPPASTTVLALAGASLHSRYSQNCFQRSRVESRYNLSNSCLLERGEERGLWAALLLLSFRRNSPASRHCLLTFLVFSNPSLSPSPFVAPISSFVVSLLVLSLRPALHGL